MKAALEEAQWILDPKACLLCFTFLILLPSQDTTDPQYCLAGLLSSTVPAAVDATELLRYDSLSAISPDVGLAREAKKQYLNKAVNASGMVPEGGGLSLLKVRPVDRGRWGGLGGKLLTPRLEAHLGCVPPSGDVYHDMVVVQISIRNY